VPRSGAPAANPFSSDAAALFGSAADMQEVFAIALNLFARELEGVYHRSHAALPLAEAVVAAGALCSANPAALLGLGDRGEVAPGKRADLVLLEIAGDPGAHRVTVRRTWTGGGAVGGP
jgi:N-acetylglucosamine-6-phosphate deacetylase